MKTESERRKIAAKPQAQRECMFIRNGRKGEGDTITDIFQIYFVYNIKENVQNEIKPKVDM